MSNDASASFDADVLIVGAGPTGLVLALWLTKQGVPVRIIDKSDGPAADSRALAVQARTLELYRQLDLADEVLARGYQVPALNLWVGGRSKARIPLPDLGRGLTPYGLVVFPQDEHERLLIERLEALSVSVERRTELVSFRDAGGGVAAVLRHADGREEACEAAYLAGCDGARSTVRKALDIGFPGGTYDQLFYVADVEATGPAANGEFHVDLDEADFLAVLPLKRAGCVRLIGTVRGERAEHPEGLRFEDVSGRAIRNMNVAVGRVNWFSTYRVHHRVVDRFRGGRVFLLGDAAHVHSPAGGQGMNTGIGDAVNLAWKLAAVLAGRAPDALLDTYEAERRPFARRLVATTDRGFTMATAGGFVARFLRTRVVPLVAPLLVRFRAARAYAFRALSQLVVAYRESVLSVRTAGSVRGGDRLPWVPAGTGDNYGCFGTIGWQVHVYGAATPELAAWCQDNHLALHAFEWQETYARSGLVRDAVYLVRPDAHIALATGRPAVTALEGYFRDHGLLLPDSPA